MDMLISFQIYEIMLSCWNPNPDARKEPQAVMRDMNQLLYRVFNSKQIHNYMTVEKDEREGSANANWISPDNWSDDGSGRSSIETITTKLDMGSISSHQQLQHTVSKGLCVIHIMFTSNKKCQSNIRYY